MSAQTRRKEPERIMNVLHNPRSNLRRTSSTQSCSSVKSWKTIGSVYKATVEAPKHNKRVTFGTQYGEQLPSKSSEERSSLMSCIMTSSTLDQRQMGGANNPAVRQTGWVARTDSECQFPAPGVTYLTGNNATLSDFEVKMSDSVPQLKHGKCGFFPKYVDPRPFKEQMTQTLYRESSAQTLPYLPDIMDAEMDEQLEIFNLAALLPGDKPPGLYEVEVLERARKRWAFNKALKTNFRQQLHMAREKLLKSKYKTIMQAFEWERWIEREEHIQECQMMRLEIVIHMFDKREKDMHTASKTRIEMACQRIEQRRQASLAKNTIEHKRTLRRLEMQKKKVPRKWVKETSLHSMASPCSEFYAPMIRHGQDPARRHFVSKSKAFDMRIDDLEKRVDMTRLQCPFTKLREWSKPKEIVKEYEQNFCSDNKLQKLYESLKGLRTQASQQKAVPKCLKKKPAPQEEEDEIRINYDFEDIDYSAYYSRHSLVFGKSRSATNLEKKMEKAAALDLGHTPEKARQMLQEQRQEALESLLCMYESTTIGWIMQFLSEEMERLKEQRKLHFFSILAQKERWRREAAEAGLRQKENDMRMLYEEMFQETNAANNEVTEDYINSILTTDMSHVAEHDAAEVITDLAKQIDRDILRWLESFKLIQRPLTFEPLRYALKDMIFPDINERLQKYENSLISAYIIDDILFPCIWDTLEPYDIASTLASDLIDRLIDNDLLFFSSDSEGEGRPPNREAEAIIRKLIRLAVPGRRWKTETERIAHENYNDLFDDIFAAILRKLDDESSEGSTSEAPGLHEVLELAHVKDFVRAEEAADSSSDIIQDISAEKLTARLKMLNIMRRVTNDIITKALTNEDTYMGDDDFKDTDADSLVHAQTYVKAEPPDYKGSNLTIHSIVGTLDISAETDFNVLRKSNCELAKLTQTASRMIPPGDELFDADADGEPQPEDQQLAEESLHELPDSETEKEYADDEYVTDESSHLQLPSSDYDYEYAADYEEQSSMSVSQVATVSETAAEEEEEEEEREQNQAIDGGEETVPTKKEEMDEPPADDEEVEIRD